MNIPEEIKTERLILRKFKEEDRPRFQAFMADDLATRHLMFSHEQKTTEGAADLLDFIIRSYDSGNPVFSLAIESNELGYIGSCGITKIGSGIWECYYSLNREFWGNGFATEAMQGLIKYCFETAKLKEIRAYIDPDHLDSINVAERLGMEYQGIQLHPFFKQQGKLYSVKIPFKFSASFDDNHIKYTY